MTLAKTLLPLLLFLQLNLRLGHYGFHPHLESVGLLSFLRCRFHRRQIGSVVPFRSIQIPHKAGDTIIGFGITGETHHVIFPLHRSEVDTVGYSAHQFIKVMHNHRPGTFKVADQLHQRQQLFATFLQLRNLGYLFIQLSNFLLQHLIALVLIIHFAIHVRDPQKSNTGRNYGYTSHHANKFFFLLFAFLDPPGEEINFRHQSKLLIASPVATIKEGASFARAAALTREATDILAKGLATRVWVPSFSSISSARPSIEATPPARIM